MFVAVDNGLLVTCDTWTGRSGGAAACEEDSPGVSEDGVGSGGCRLDSLDREKPLNLRGISIQTIATLELKELKKCVRRNNHSCALQISGDVTHLIDWTDRPITKLHKVLFELAPISTRCHPCSLSSQILATWG